MPLLGVNRSATGQRWLEAVVDERMALALAQGQGVPEIVGRVMARRGVTPDMAELFLNPRLRSLLPDPSCLRDMDLAANRLAQAVQRQETLALLTDYDVDGASSAALLIRFLRHAGIEPLLHVPDRVTEGYGPGVAALAALQAKGATLVLTLDCGTTAFGPLSEASAMGLEVIVVDHHAAEAQLPAAVAVVNPNRLDESAETEGLRKLAAVGVCYLLVVATHRRLRADGYYADRGGSPDLLAWLDLVAIGTICDVMPLIGLNRVFVAQGLKVARRRANVGLAALVDVCGVKSPLDAWHMGFQLGPRLNAGGRLADPTQGTRLLVSDDPHEAANLARQLDEINGRRRDVETEVMEAARALVAPDASDQPMVLLAGEGWHPGVIGIVAARLREMIRRPVLVASVDGGIARASGRSIPGVDLGAAVIAARHAGLVTHGGGHRMACGFTAQAEKLPEIAAFLSQAVAATEGVAELPVLEIDAVVSAAALGEQLANSFSVLAPFGAGNPEPRIAVADLRIIRADIVGNGHVRVVATAADGARVSAIAFRAANDHAELSRLLRDTSGQPIHLAGTLRLNHWNGRTQASLQIEDAAAAWSCGG